MVPSTFAPSTPPSLSDQLLPLSNTTQIATIFIIASLHDKSEGILTGHLSTSSSTSWISCTSCSCFSSTLLLDHRQPNKLAAMATHTKNEATMRSLGSQSRRLTEGMKDLEKFNINTTLTSLPKYVVVGDQSAGKSSIVQALCGVSLPRSQGTTTRCPFRITTSKKGSSSKSWTCHVYLQQHSDSILAQYSLPGNPSVQPSRA